MARISEWILGIIGAVAAFMGVVILSAGADQYIGIGGDLTWRVGDIAPAWGYGFLAGGGVLLAVTAWILLVERRHPHEHAERSERVGLLSHIAVFIIVNGFLWLQDILAGNGLEYAYWVTIPWGVGLLAHIFTYIGRGMSAGESHHLHTPAHT